MCCLIYKGTEVEGRELKLHRLTANKKLQKVRWSPLSETGQKGDSMFASVICTALFYTMLVTLLWTEFFPYPDAFKNWDGTRTEGSPSTVAVFSDIVHCTYSPFMRIYIDKLIANAIC